MNEDLEPEWRVRIVPRGEDRWHCILMTQQNAYGDWLGDVDWAEHFGIHVGFLRDNTYSRKSAEKKARKIIALLHKAWVHQQNGSFVVTAKEQ